VSLAPDRSGCPFPSLSGGLRSRLPPPEDEV
jgi:hypothetical protein